jgi:glycine betaine transporter
MPPIGLYLARLGKGRTVRQFLLMNVLAPSVFVFLWVKPFGSLAIYYQWTGLVDVWSFVQTQGLESAVIGILQRFPLSGVLIAFFITITIISFVSLVDPMSSVLATISTRGISAEEEAPALLKVLWGSNMGGVALAVITLCGILALRGMFVFGGVLMMFLTVALCWCIVKEGLWLLSGKKEF